MAFTKSNMYFTQLIILSFVGFCQCYRYEEKSIGLSIEVTPETAVDLMKRSVEFVDKQIMKRLWATEEGTCDEVSSVLSTFSKYMESDLDLLFMDAKKHLEQVPARGNRKMKRCMQGIQDSIDDAVQEGVETFGRCAELSRVMQNQEKAKTDKSRKEYERSINYTLTNIDRCLDFSNKASQVHRDLCIADVVQESYKYFKADPKVSFSESKCIDQFSDFLLNCTSNVLNTAVQKKRELKEDIVLCLGYVHLNDDQEDLKVTVNNILSKYIKSYKTLSYHYSKDILYMFLKITLWKLEQLGYNNSANEVLMKNHLWAYYNALEKTKEDNRSLRSRECYNTAISSLNSLVSEALKDDKECISSSLRKIDETFDKFNTTVTEFNTKLQEGGHVAFLRCFNQRPQNIFNSSSAKDCAELAARRIEWERRKVVIQLSNLMKSLKPDDIVDIARTVDNYSTPPKHLRRLLQDIPANNSTPDSLPEYSTTDTTGTVDSKANGNGISITCGQLRRDKLFLDADVVLDTCSRCLYGVSGDMYAVTTPPTYTWTHQPWPATTNDPEYIDEEGYTGTPPYEENMLYTEA